MQQEDQIYILINICTQKQRQQQMCLLSQEEIISFMPFVMIHARLCYQILVQFIPLLMQGVIKHCSAQTL